MSSDPTLNVHRRRAETVGIYHMGQLALVGEFAFNGWERCHRNIVLPDNQVFLGRADNDGLRELAVNLAREPVHEFPLLTRGASPFYVTGTGLAGGAGGGSYRFARELAPSGSVRELRGRNDSRWNPTLLPSDAFE